MFEGAEFERVPIVVVTALVFLKALVREARSTVAFVSGGEKFDLAHRPVGFYVGCVLEVGFEVDHYAAGFLVVISE